MASTEDFYSVPVFLFKCIGSSIPPFGKQNPRKIKQKFLDIIHILMFCYLILFIGYILAYIFNAIEIKNYEMALISGSSICGAISCVLKRLAMSLKIKEMRQIKDELESIFPKTKAKLVWLKVKVYKQSVQKFCFYYTLITIGSCTCWCLKPVLIGLLKYVLYKRPYERDLIFYGYYFYDTRSNICIYIFSYFMEMVSGYFATILTFGIDMFICSIIIQCCMHFDFISRKLEEYNPRNAISNDNNILQLLILHRRCLQ